MKYSIKTFLLTLLATFMNSCMQSNIIDYKDSVTNKYKLTEMSLFEHEKSILDKSAVNNRDAIKRSFSLWHESVDVYLKSKYNEDQGSVSLYYELDDREKIYSDRIKDLENIYFIN